MKYTITQNFIYASLTIYDCGATEDSISEAMDALIEVFGKESVHFQFCDTNPDDDNFIVINLERPNGYPYYEYECEVQPGYPAKLDGPAENCYPGEDTAIYCYQDTTELITDLVKMPYDWDVEDEEYDDEDYLREQWYIMNDGDDEY